MYRAPRDCRALPAALPVGRQGRQVARTSLLAMTLLYFIMKTKTQFVCQECGYESSQWLGKCPECGNWNTLKEFRIKKQESRSKERIGLPSSALTPKKLQEITSTEKTRIKTGFSEMDTVLGGGIVQGSVILL